MENNKESTAIKPDLEPNCTGVKLRFFSRVRTVLLRVIVNNIKINNLQWTSLCNCLVVFL